ncbi:putative peroxygenase 4 [Drosera capensis]
MADSSMAAVVPSTDGNHDPGENVLMKHVQFFDKNKDGIVFPSETFKGFRAIGAGILLSSLAAVVINVGLSSKTRPHVYGLELTSEEEGKGFSWQFPIEIKNIALAKHGSDSGVYDAEGRFVPAKFEAIFSKYALSHHDTLMWEELKQMLKANRVPKDYAGWFAAYIEWKILYVLAKDKNGLLPKDRVRGVYDGSLFEKLEKERESSKKKT